MTVVDDDTLAIRGELKRHSDEVVVAYRRWFDNIPKRPQYKGFLLVEYTMPAAAVYLYANGEIVIHRLALPDDLAIHREELKGHLGAERWKQWEVLIAEVGDHQDAAVGLWNEVGGRMEIAARQAGLFASSKPTQDPPDAYWPELFMASILQEPEVFAQKRVHGWDAVKVVEENYHVPSKHERDAVHTWVFESSNMVRSQSLESLRMFMKSWRDEALRAEPKIVGLSSERARIETNAKEFQKMLRDLQEEYVRAAKLSGACPTCKPMLESLGLTQQSSAP
jgi:hypothetical protein